MNIFENKLYRFVDFKTTKNQGEIERHELLVRFTKDEIVFSTIDSREKIIIAMHAIAFFYQNLPELESNLLVRGMQLFYDLENPVVNRDPKLLYGKRFSESDFIVDIFLDNPRAMHVCADDHEDDYFFIDSRYRHPRLEELEKIAPNLMKEVNNFNSTDFIFLNYRVKNFREILEKYKQYCFYKVGILLSLNYWEERLRHFLEYEFVFSYNLPELVNLWYYVMRYQKMHLRDYFSTDSGTHKRLLREHQEGLSSGQSTFKRSFLEELNKIYKQDEIARRLLEDIEFYKEDLIEIYRSSFGSKHGFFKRKLLKVYRDILLNHPYVSGTILQILRNNFFATPTMSKEVISSRNALIVPVHIFFQSNKQYMDMQRRLKNEKKAFFVANQEMTMLCDVDSFSWERFNNDFWFGSVFKDSFSWKRCNANFWHSKVFISGGFRNMFLRNNLSGGQQMPTWNYARRSLNEKRKGHAHYANLEKLL